MSKSFPSCLGSSSNHFPPSHHSQLRDADRHHERHQSASAANRSYAELVKWQGHAIRLPLLRLPNDLAPLALECFDCILRYCGDIPLDPELTEVKCVYTVLMVSAKFSSCPLLRILICSSTILAALPQVSGSARRGLLPADEADHGE